jgi:hypothetical protein
MKLLKIPIKVQFEINFFDKGFGQKVRKILFFQPTLLEKFCQLFAPLALDFFEYLS